MGVVNDSQIPDVIREKNVIMKHPTDCIKQSNVQALDVCIYDSGTLLPEKIYSNDNKTSITMDPG